jgi:hypothetical protein
MKRVCFKTRSVLTDEENPKLTIGCIGTFSFDGVISTFDKTDRIIMGLPKSGKATYEDVLNCIDYRDRTRFEETTLGIKDKSPLVEFSPILLANGNIIQDTHYRTFDSEGKLTKINGFTKLLKEA